MRILLIWTRIPIVGLERPLRDHIENFYFNFHVTTIFVCMNTRGPLLLLIKKKAFIFACLRSVLKLTHLLFRINLELIWILPFKPFVSVSLSGSGPGSCLSYYSKSVAIISQRTGGGGGKGLATNRRLVAELKGQGTR
jgi:hypothetical protein